MVDPTKYNLIKKIRNNFKSFLFEVKGAKTIAKYEKLFKCSKNDYLKHFENLFHSNMSWDNYGHYWHIEHIKPLYFFDLTKKPNIRQAYSLKNLQPILVKDHYKKTSKDLSDISKLRHSEKKKRYPNNKNILDNF